MHFKEDKLYIYYENGEIFEKSRKALVKFNLNDDGYLFFYDENYKTPKYTLVDEIIYKKFIGRINGEIIHKNGIRINNAVDNLEIKKENKKIDFWNLFF
jgi:hypothetical protein